MADTTTHTLEDLAASVEIECTRDVRKRWDRLDDWQRNANGYRVTLRFRGRRMSLDFWQGTGIKDEPTSRRVLECLLSDAQLGALNFEEFCSELGFDPDSRKALASWKECGRIDLRLRRLLGGSFDEFME